MPSSAERDARDLVEARFPGALYSFLGGSRATATSDLDIVVVLPEVRPYRENLRWREWPVELFVHNELSLTGWADRDLATRHPTMPRLCAEGVVLTDPSGKAARVRARMRARLAAGP
ncbi:MAG: nucleotidyltransferase domain-containing protein, partial [Nonomuraea sp.]|nr:nucleotidyltransferase domain-containing protein [Nonomuraea sp.]